MKHSLEIWPQEPALSGKCHMFAQREDSKETSTPGANTTDVPSSLLCSQRIKRLRGTGSSDGMDSFGGCNSDLRQDVERALVIFVKTQRGLSAAAAQMPFRGTPTRSLVCIFRFFAGLRAVFTHIPCAFY